MLLEVGHIVKAHGLRGEVVVELVTNRAERLTPGSVLDAGDRQLVVRASSRFGPANAPRGGRWIVSFGGLVGRDAAEGLRGLTLRAEPLEDPAGLWVHDLIDATVIDESGVELGTVVSVQANPASDLLVLESGALIPLRFVTAQSDTTVTVSLPEGLLDLF